MNRFRWSDFSDDEIVVLNIALSEDFGNWNSDEKEKIRKALVDETNAEVEARNLIPND